MMDFIEQKQQEYTHIEEELVTINSKTPCLSESTGVINEISVNLLSQFLISKNTTSYEILFNQLSMINSVEAETLEPVSTFESTINDIKDNHLKLLPPLP